MPEWPFLMAGSYPGGLTMARIRITLEDDDGREINGDKERLYNLSVEPTRLVDIAAAVVALKQGALPELSSDYLACAYLQLGAGVNNRPSPNFIPRLPIT